MEEWLHQNFNQLVNSRQLLGRQQRVVIELRIRMDNIRKLVVVSVFTEGFSEVLLWRLLLELLSEARQESRK